MNTVVKNCLSDTDKQEINKLIEACSTSDGIKYSFYLGEDGCADDIFLLLYENQQLIGYVFCISTDIPEVSGIIAPSYRRNGYFSSSLSLLPHKNYIFSGHNDWPNLKYVSIKLGFNFCFHEFLMEYKEKSNTIKSQLRYKIKKNQFIFYSGLSKIGHCQLYIEADTINIFDVFVKRNRRNNGYGKMIISQILSLYSNHDKRIILQVSEKNKPAYKLYAACGFEVIDSVLYYSRLV